MHSSVYRDKHEEKFDDIIKEIYLEGKKMPYKFVKKGESTKYQQTYRYREQTDGYQRGGDLGKLGDNGEGIKMYRLVVTK